MKPLYSFLDAIRAIVRPPIVALARFLHTISGGRITPNGITVFGLLMHAPIAYFIAMGENYWAAAPLVVFGLFDTLDGALARLQNRANNAGMLLDATTDRFKEVLLYTGVGYALAASANPKTAAWAAAACGASICVSYVKAKGELAVKDSELTANQINRLFQDGLLRFEVRMFVLVVGLIADQLLYATAIIAVLAAYTAIDRLVTIARKI